MSYTASELQDAINQRINTDNNFKTKFNNAKNSKSKQVLRRLIIEVADWMFGRAAKEIVSAVFLLFFPDND